MPACPFLPTIPISVPSDCDDDCLVAAAKRFMQDPTLLSQLSDRVYELWLTDLRYQQERSRNYRNGRI